jgi:hypothetical protein
MVPVAGVLTLLKVESSAGFGGSGVPWGVDGEPLGRSIPGRSLISMSFLLLKNPSGFG